MCVILFILQRISVPSIILIMFMIPILPVCCCALLNFESFIQGYFLSFYSFVFIYVVWLLLLLLFLFCFCFACSFKWKKSSTWLDLTNQNGGLPTKLMVKVPPNYNSRKDYSLQQINNSDNRRLSINCTESIKQGRRKKRRKRKRKRKKRKKKKKRKKRGWSVESTLT